MNQQYNIKFSTVNLLDVMGRVVEKHTQHYQSDFAIDTDTLRKAAVAEMQQDKSFIWLCRTMGTWCLRERDVFLTDTRQHNTFCFYQEQVKEPVLVYTVEVKCAVDGNVIGKPMSKLSLNSVYHIVDKTRNFVQISFQNRDYRWSVCGKRLTNRTEYIT